MAYTVTGRGQASDEDDGTLTFTSYQAADGTKLTLFHKRCASAARAIEFLDRQIKRATKVVKRSQKTDRDHNVVGQRAQILVVLAGGEEVDPAVAWTEGSDYYEILSDSLCSILELERRLSP